MPSERAQVLILNGVYANDSDTFPNSRSYFNNWYATACTAPAQHGARDGFCRHAERCCKCACQAPKRATAMMARIVYLPVVAEMPKFVLRDMVR